MTDRTKLTNGLTPAQYAEFFAEMAAAPCTREAIDALHRKHFPLAQYSVRYPDEYYADKDNRMAGEPTGHMRCEGVSSGNIRMVWVPNNRGVAA